MMKNPFFIDIKILIKQSGLNENGCDFNKVKALTVTDLFFLSHHLKKNQLVKLESY
jgi:hypothetical protein